MHEYSITTRHRAARVLGEVPIAPSAPGKAHFPKFGQVRDAGTPLSGCRHRILPPIPWTIGHAPKGYGIAPARQSRRERG
ncbi:hypothetical protein ACFSLT_05335 [Novosphingobium resinovorum]